MQNISSKYLQLYEECIINLHVSIRAGGRFQTLEEQTPERVL